MQMRYWQYLAIRAQVFFTPVLRLIVKFTRLVTVFVSGWVDLQSERWKISSFSGTKNHHPTIIKSKHARGLCQFAVPLHFFVPACLFIGACRRPFDRAIWWRTVPPRRRRRLFKRGEGRVSLNGFPFSLCHFREFFSTERSNYIGL